MRKALDESVEAARELESAKNYVDFRMQYAISQSAVQQSPRRSSSPVPLDLDRDIVTGSRRDPRIPDYVPDGWGESKKRSTSVETPTFGGTPSLLPEKHPFA